MPWNFQLNHYFFFSSFIIKSLHHFSSSIFLLSNKTQNCFLVLMRSCWIKYGVVTHLFTFITSILVEFTYLIYWIDLIQSFAIPMVPLCIRSMNTRSVLIVLSFSRRTWCYVFADWLWLWLLLTPLLSFIDVSNFLRTETKWYSFIHIVLLVDSIHRKYTQNWINKENNERTKALPSTHNVKIHYVCNYAARRLNTQ